MDPCRGPKIVSYHIVTCDTYHHINLYRVGLIYQGTYSQNLKKKLYFENFVIVKVRAKSCDHHFLVPLYVPLKVHYPIPDAHLGKKIIFTRQLWDIIWHDWYKAVSLRYPTSSWQKCQCTAPWKIFKFFGGLHCIWRYGETQGVQEVQKNTFGKYFTEGIPR